jgi:hypothetical protein
MICRKDCERRAPVWPGGPYGDGQAPGVPETLSAARGEQKQTDDAAFSRVAVAGGEQAAASGTR